MYLRILEILLAVIISTGSLSSFAAAGESDWNGVYACADGDGSNIKLAFPFVDRDIPTDRKPKSGIDQKNTCHRLLSKLNYGKASKYIAIYTPNSSQYQIIVRAGLNENPYASKRVRSLQVQSALTLDEYMFRTKAAIVLGTGFRSIGDADGSNVLVVPRQIIQSPNDYLIDAGLKYALCSDEKYLTKLVDLGDAYAWRTRARSLESSTCIQVGPLLDSTSSNGSQVRESGKEEISDKRDSIAEMLIRTPYQVVTFVCFKGLTPGSVGNPIAIGLAAGMRDLNELRSAIAQSQPNCRQFLLVGDTVSAGLLGKGFHLGQSDNLNDAVIAVILDEPG